MKRLFDFFHNAKGCHPNKRRVGLEIETLFIDKNGLPISFPLSQAIFVSLAKTGDWKIAKEKNGVITHLVNPGSDFELFYELGWNNFELTTPTWLIEEIAWGEILANLDQLYSTAETLGAYPVFSFTDDCLLHDTLALPDKRDHIWAELDGRQALRVLGHIATVHFNLDLVSLDQGMDYIRQINGYYSRAKSDPTSHQHDEIWMSYIRNSKAQYETDRYGFAPDYSSYHYFRRLSELKVVMTCQNNKLKLCRLARPFSQTEAVNLDLFLRSVWWHSRLRVRGGTLVLELRNNLRGADEMIEEEWTKIKQILGL
ncbi:hypothetical protein ACFLZY_01560 [Patescibacteria group bacterium]